jgi:site-specific recombinase XerD
LRGDDDDPFTPANDRGHAVARLIPNTQKTYLHQVSLLAQHYGCSPDQITEEEIRAYFLYLRNERQLSQGSYRIALSAIKFLFTFALKREWTIFDLLRPRTEKKLPVVLSVEEVRHLLGCVRRPHYRVCLSTIYACGLRVSEGAGVVTQSLSTKRGSVQNLVLKYRIDSLVFLRKTKISLQFYADLCRFSEG